MHKFFTTPIQLLEAGAELPPADGSPAAKGPPSGRGGGKGGPPDFSKMTPEQLEQAKQRMRARGMTEEQIDERLKQARSGAR